MMQTPTAHSEAIQFAVTPSSSTQHMPSGISGIKLAEGKEQIFDVGGFSIKSIVYPPSRVVHPEQTVTIYAAAGGQGLGHIVPMDGWLTELRGLPDVRVVFDKNPPVHTFNRDIKDHLRYKATNVGALGRMSNKFRENYSAKNEFNAFAKRLQEVTSDHKMPINLGVFNHRFGAHTASEKFPSDIPMAEFIPDWGKNHKGWFNPRILGNTRSNPLDRLFVTNDTAAAHACKYGVHRETIQTLGYPMRAAYKEWANKTKEEARQELGVQEGKQVLLMSAGNARNPGAFVDQVSGLLKHPDAKNLHLVALCNKNEELMAQLNALGRGDIIHPVGTQDENGMARLLRAAHKNAIQPGGGSLADCYAMEVVGILYDEKSGIEHANADHAGRNGTAIIAFERQSLKNAFKPSKERSAQMFREAVFETPKERLDQILVNQKPFRELALNGAQRMAKTLYTLARLQAGFPVDDESLLTEGRPVGPTPALTGTSGTQLLTPSSAFDVSSPTSPQQATVSGSEVLRF